MAIGVDHNFGAAAARHFVSLQWVDKTPGARADANSGSGTPFAVSGFVVSIRGHWFLITAGHVLADLERALTSGQLLTNFRLSDGYVRLEASFKPIPFPFRDAHKWHYLNDAVGCDYGCIHLRSNTEALLSANGIVALGEFAWRDELPEHFEEFVLTGIPSEMTISRRVQRGVAFRTSLIAFGVDPCTNAPDGFNADGARMIYRVDPLILDDGRKLASVDGMSGSPLFGILHSSATKHRYWVIGIQSAELKRNGVVSHIAVCPFLPLGEFLETMLGMIAVARDGTLETDGKATGD
jgi:hypothetical protein